MTPLLYDTLTEQKRKTIEALYPEFCAHGKVFISILTEVPDQDDEGSPVQAMSNLHVPDTIERHQGSLAGLQHITLSVGLTACKGMYYDSEHKVFIFDISVKGKPTLVAVPPLLIVSMYCPDNREWLYTNGSVGDVSVYQQLYYSPSGMVCPHQRWLLSEKPAPETLGDNIVSLKRH